MARRVDEVGTERARPLLEALGVSGAAGDAWLFLYEGDSPRGVLAVERLAFDSEIFGAPSARIGTLTAPDESGYRALLGRLDELCRGRGIRHLVRRLPLEQNQQAWALAGSGFRQVDVTVVFARAPVASGAPIPQVRPVESAEAERLAERFAASFTFTRFAVDPFCRPEPAAELHRRWIVNSCRGRAQAVLVWDREGEALGFVTCLLDERTRVGNIELLAVDPAARGAGVGRALIAGALDWFAPRAAKVEVRTQLVNRGATALYEASGFRIDKGELTFTRIIDQENSSP